MPHASHGLKVRCVCHYLGALIIGWIHTSKPRVGAGAFLFGVFLEIVYCVHVIRGVRDILSENK
jgi:hypothetical protein